MSQSQGSFVILFIRLPRVSLEISNVNTELIPVYCGFYGFICHRVLNSAVCLDACLHALLQQTIVNILLTRPTASFLSCIKRYLLNFYMLPNFTIAWVCLFCLPLLLCTSFSPVVNVLTNTVRINPAKNRHKTVISYSISCQVTMT